MILPNTIHLGDCLDIMPQIADKSVDMVLCDLPYGTTSCKWDVVIPFDLLWEQYRRITKPNAAICLFAQQPFASELAHSNISMFKYEWIWEKDNSTGFLHANQMPLKKHENILVFYRKLPTYNPQGVRYNPRKVRRGHLGDNYLHTTSNEYQSQYENYPTDIIKFNRDKEKYHSTQKPVELLQYLIRTYTNESDIVLDNTMGSGSTIVAAIRENRQYIGIEKNEKYFDIANKRIAAEMSQLSLF